MGMIPQCDKRSAHLREARSSGDRTWRLHPHAATPVYLISLVFLKTGLPSFTSPMSKRSEYSSWFLWSTWKRAQRSAFTRFLA